MSLRFFSDQCVPAEITDTLRRHAHEVTLLRDVLPIRSLDPQPAGKWIERFEEWLADSKFLNR